jgi:hypothetical protein
LKHRDRRRADCDAIGDVCRTDPPVVDASIAGRRRPPVSHASPRLLQHKSRRADAAAQLDAKPVNIFILKYYY